MKRKDWITKKLRKDIYDNYFNKKPKIVSRYDKFIKRLISEKKFFLRKLFLRKNLVLIKKNHAPNFFFYKSMIKSFLNIKYFNFKTLNNLESFEHTIIFPDFFHKKQVLNNWKINS